MERKSSLKGDERMNIFSFRDIIMWKLKHNEPLEENELRTIENALTMDCLRSEVLSQSLGGHENTFRLSTAMPRIQQKAKSEEKAKENSIMRYEAMLGPNTNQWWIYDNEKDIYIDPPQTIHEEISKTGDSQFVEDYLNDVCNRLKPIWLFEEEFWYSDIEI